MTTRHRSTNGRKFNSKSSHLNAAFFLKPVDMVTVPGLGGELGILPGHTPLISQLQTGVLTYIRTARVFSCTSPADLSKSATITFQCSPKSRNVPKRSTPPARELSREQVEKQLSAWSGTEEDFEKARAKLDRSVVTAATFGSRRKTHRLP